VRAAFSSRQTPSFTVTFEKAHHELCSGGAHGSGE